MRGCCAVGDGRRGAGGFVCAGVAVSQGAGGELGFGACEREGVGDGGFLCAGGGRGGGGCAGDAGGWNNYCQSCFEERAGGSGAFSVCAECGGAEILCLFWECGCAAGARGDGGWEVHGRDSGGASAEEVYAAA